MKEMKDSLEANKAEIMKSLPEEFHADFNNEIAALSDASPAPLSPDAEIAAVKAELVANPAVDESAAAAELKDIKAPTPVVPATEEELAAEKAELLKEAKAMGENTSE